ncbi:MAG TPA: hypothetical protein PLQ76_07695 [bacterium]|nr:hypothetical protein [bacterium]
MTDKELCSYDEVFVESIIEEINEMMFDKYKDDETMPLLGVVAKDGIPCDIAIWVHMFKTSDVKKKLGK